MLKSAFLAAGLMAGLGALANGAGAQPLSLSEVVSTELIAGWQTDEGDHIGALKITLAPGWKTYWRVGDGLGIPPRFDWGGSINLGSVEYLWPRPQLVTSFGVQTLGYQDRLVLPIRFRPQVAGEEILATARLDIGVCQDVCLPVSTSITNVLGAEPGDQGPLIEAALRDRPISGEQAGIGEVECRLQPIEEGYSLNASFTLPAGLETDRMVVFETPLPDIWVAQAKTRREGDRLLAETELLSFDGQPFEIDPARFRITLVGKDQSVEILGCPTGNG